MSVRVQDIELSELEEQMLTIIVCSFGATLFNQQTLLDLFAGTQYAQSELKVGLIELCNKEWVVCMRRIAGERVFCVSYKRYILHMAQILSERVSELSPVMQLEQPAQCWTQDFIMDLVILCAQINNTQRRLNKKGQLDKKDIDCLLKHIQLCPERLAPHLWMKDVSKLTYPLSLALLLDIGLRLRILYNSDGILTVDQEQISEWLNRSSSDLLNEVYHLWFEVHYPEQHPIRQLLITLPILANDEWYAIHQILDQDEQFNAAQIELYMSVFQELGWLRIGRTIDGTQAILSLLGDNSKDNEQDESWYVLPDFEAVVSPRAPYSDHYQLNAYATLTSRDQMYIYRITKESTFIAFQRGWTASLILEHLSSRARYGVPENIQITIGEWDKLYRGVQLETVHIMRCETSDIAEQLMMLPEVRTIVNEDNRLDSKRFLIPTGEVDFIRAQMNKYGYYMDHTLTKPLTKLSAPTQLSSSHGLFHSRLRYDMYTPDDQCTEIASLYPGLSDIPSSWLNSYIAYHISTRKQLLHQAIQWQCYVQVAHDGKDMLIAPYAIRMDNSTPILEAKLYNKMIEIPIYSMQSLRLIVPGIHDISKIDVNNCFNS